MRFPWMRFILITVTLTLLFPIKAHAVDANTFSQKLYDIEKNTLNQHDERALSQQLFALNQLAQELLFCEENANQQIKTLNELSLDNKSIKRQEQQLLDQLLNCRTLTQKVHTLQKKLSSHIDSLSFDRYKSSQISLWQQSTDFNLNIGIQQLLQLIDFTVLIGTWLGFSVIWFLLRPMSRKNQDGLVYDLPLIALFLVFGYVILWFIGANNRDPALESWFVIALSSLLYQAHIKHYSLTSWFKSSYLLLTIFSTADYWLTAPSAETIIEPVFLDLLIGVLWFFALYWNLESKSKKVKVGLWLSALFLLILDSSGFHRIAHQLIISALTLSLAWWSYRYIRALVPAVMSWLTFYQTKLKQPVGWLAVLTEPLAGAKWIRLAIGSTAILWLLLAQLPFLGLPVHHAQQLKLWLLDGFVLGTIAVIPTSIITALYVFGLLLSIARIVKQRIEQNVEQKQSITQGSSEAVAAIFWYSSVATSALIGLSIAGFSVQNLALVAGAFSIGIGFGLQNIVSNFVSGLILLIERPIKRGDWVVIGTTEGIVKKVSIRATEIQTFDRADIIVPNSDLITHQVTNWMHNDSVGRIRLSVGVAYGSNTEKVRDIIASILQSNAEIISDDPNYPYLVLFVGFGDSSLNFEARAFLKDIAKIHRVRSELNFAIDKAFRENKIEIPFPQRDLHLRSDSTKKDS